MRSALRRAGRGVDYLEIDRATHDVDRLAHRVEAMRTVEAFLARHLLTAEARVAAAP